VSLLLRRLGENMPMFGHPAILCITCNFPNLFSLKNILLYIYEYSNIYLWYCQLLLVGNFSQIFRFRYLCEVFDL
jgi:hypothetical protein